MLIESNNGRTWNKEQAGMFGRREEKKAHGSGQAAINSDKELESRANSAAEEGREARAKNKTHHAGKREL